MKNLFYSLLIFPLVLSCQNQAASTELEIKITNNSKYEIDSVVVDEGVAKKLLIDKKIYPNNSYSFKINCVNPQKNEGIYSLKIYKNKTMSQHMYCLYD